MKYVKEYISAVVKRWLGIVFIGGDSAAIISGALGKTWLIPWWAWLIIGTVGLALAQFEAYRKVREDLDKATNKVEGAIRELEREVTKLGGKDINMASLFWKMGERFLGEGMRPASIPDSIYGVFDGAEKDECNKAWAKLMKRLELSQLIYDMEKPHPFKSTGYIRIKLTPLGTSVLNELDRRWRSS